METGGGRRTRPLSRYGARFVLVSLIGLAAATGSMACSSSAPPETVGSTSSAVTVAPNTPVETDYGYDTTSVAVYSGAWISVCGGGGACGPFEIVGMQDDVPADWSQSFRNLDAYATSEEAPNTIHTSAEWGLPSEAPSYPDTFTGYTGHPNMVSVDGYNFDYVGLGATGTGYLNTEVTVHGFREDQTHFLTTTLNPAIYPFLSTSGSPGGYPTNTITDVSVAADPASGLVWVLWTIPQYCDPAFGCGPDARTLLTNYHFDAAGGFVHGPTWSLTYTSPTGGTLPVAPVGLTRMALKSMGGGPPLLYIGWPDEPDITWTCNPSYPLNWHVTTVQPSTDPSGHSQPPVVTDRIVLSDPYHQNCANVASPNPGYTSGRPAMFYDAQSDEVWLLANKTQYYNGYNYGMRVVFAFDDGNYQGPITGYYQSCATPRRILPDGTGDGIQCFQWDPGATVSPVPEQQGNIAIYTWREAAPADGYKVNYWGSSFTPLLPLNQTFFKVAQFAQPGIEVPWFQTNPIDYAAMPWGRYDGIAADPATGTFFAAWTDNRADAPSNRRSNVWTTTIQSPW